MSDDLLDRMSRMLARDCSRLTDQRIKADDFGTRPIAREALMLLAEWLDDRGESALAERLRCAT